MATTPIKLKRSNTISVIPDTSDLIEGEVALNTVDRKLYVRNDSSSVITLANHYATDFDSSNITFKVTVATSTSAHPYHGVGSGNKYKINGIFAPYLKLIPRNTYRFDQADSSNSGHPLRFYLDIDKSTEYTNGVTTNGTPGSAGAYTQIVVGDDTPPTLFYQCSAHANMGWAATTSTRTDLDDPWLGSHTDTVKEYVVVVATKDDAHVYNGQGSSLGYKVDGVFSPVLQFQLGKTYRFNQSDNSNSGHPINFYYAASKSGGNYTTDVTVNGTAGSSGAYTQILITEATPPVLHYQCTNHGYMGHASVIGTRNLTGFDTDDLSEGSSNLYHTTARANTAIDNRVTNTFINNLSGIVADTTTALATARDIGGVSFDGTANINLPGVNTSGNQDTSGNAATATALETARNIHGVSFDGTGNIDLTEVIQDTVGAMFSGNTETNITATYQDSDGTIDLIASGGGGSASDSFKTISVSGQSDVVADSSTDTLTLVAGSNMTITTNASGDEITFVSSGGSGGSGENVSWSVTQSSHGLAVGDVIYNNGTNYVKAQANATGTLGLFIVSAVANTNTFTATFSGKITLSSLTAGQYYFVSTTSAGDFTETEPTTGYSNPILFALSTTEAVVLPYRPQDLPSSGDAAQGRTLLDVFSKSETNSKISAFAIALGG